MGHHEDQMRLAKERLEDTAADASRVDAVAARARNKASAAKEATEREENMMRPEQKGSNTQVAVREAIGPTTRSRDNITKNR